MAMNKKLFTALHGAEKPRKSSGRMASKGHPNPIDVLIGQRMRSRRTVLGISQEKLGEQIGLTFQQVQKYEKGTNRISGSRLWDVSRVLDVPVSYFFNDMPAEISKQSPGQLRNGVPTAQVAPDEMNRRETLELVRAYYKIEDGQTRHKITALVRQIGRSA